MSKALGLLYTFFQKCLNFEQFRSHLHSSSYAIIAQEHDYEPPQPAVPSKAVVTQPSSAYLQH